MKDSKEPPEVTMSRLIEKMRASKTTPYGSPGCTYSRQKATLLTTAMLLKVKGHSQISDYMDSEIAKMDRIPKLDTEIDNYLRALSAQIKLSIEIWDYCEQNSDLADILPHLSFCRQAQKHAG